MKPALAGLALAMLLTVAGCAAPTATRTHHAHGSAQPSAAPTVSPSTPPPITPAPAAPSATPAPTPTPTAAPAPASPTPTPVQVQSGVCGSSGTVISVQGNLTLNGAPYQLQLVMADYHGPGTYSIPPERVSIQSPNPSPTQPLRPALSGTVTINPGGQGGSVNATLGPAGQPPLQLNATWTCA